MKYKITILILFCFFVIHAQKLDSLKALLNTKLSDTNKIITYLAISSELTHENVDESFKYAYLANSLSKKINFQRGIGDSYKSLGTLHSFNTDDSALFYLNKAKAIKLKLKDFKSLASIYTNLGTCYDKLGDAQQALNYYLASLRLSDSLGLDLGIGGASLGLGNVFSTSKNFGKAIEYYHKSVDAYTRAGSSYVSWAINNLANCYMQTGDYAKAKKMYEESLRIKLDNKDYYGAVFSIDNIGLILIEEEKYAEALSYFKKALKINRENKFEKETFANSYLNIANAMLGLKSNAFANRYLDSMEKILSQLTLSELSLSYLNSRAIYYENIKDYKNAFAFKSRHLKIKDSLFTSDMTKQMAEADSKYKSEKRQKDIELLQKDKVIQQIEIDKHQTQRNAFILGLSILLILLIFIFRGYLQKKKINVIITQQKKEVELQKSLVDEHQKEILDSIHYAKRIQNTLLAHTDFVNENIPNNFILFKPKDIVSGDFYWATKKGDLFYIAVCDSTGHGVPGAFMSLLNIGFLSEAINEKNIIKPNEIFNHVRERLVNSISKEGQQDGFDGMLLCINQKTKKITYAAANNAPIVISNSEIIQLDADKMPVGKGVKETPFQLYTIELKENDSLYLYTDGYADQFGGPKGKKFLYKKMNQLIASVSNLPFDKRREKLDVAFEDWKGNLEQVDDVLIVGIKLS